MTGLAPARQDALSVRQLRPAAAAAPLRTLLLHGLGCGATVWDPFVERAGRRLELWGAELPWGPGGTGEWAQEADARSWVARAIELTDGGPDVVIAHSFSANVLLELLDAEGQRGLHAVVLVSPFYRPEPERFDWAAISYYLNDFDRILEEGIRVRSASRLKPDVQHAMALRVRDRIGPYGWMRFFDAYLRTPRLRTAHLPGPFLVVGGTDDFAAFPSDGRALGRALPAARVEILRDCGHFAMAERPDRFAELVDEFLETEA
jgi:pimeloyl-ACP methyl ester carboxylesterase